MEEKSFSFFVPTYGREESLYQTIDSIFKYWGPNNFKEIIISDNNENDLALKVVEKFDQKLIRYSPNVNNIGIDRNMLKFLNLCESKYCWLLGDDDALNKNSYELIEPLLHEDLDFIVLLDGTPVNNYKTGIHEMGDVDAVGEVMLAFWDKLPFGNIIINVERAKQLNSVEIFDKYIGTSHAYSAVLWETALSSFSSGKFGVITAKAVEVGEVKKTWVSSSVKIHLEEIPAWFGLLPKVISKYTSEAYSRYLQLIFNPGFLLSHVRFMKISEENKRNMEKSMGKMPFKYKIKLKFAYFVYPFYLKYKALKG